MFWQPRMFLSPPFCSWEYLGRLLQRLLGRELWDDQIFICENFSLWCNSLDQDQIFAVHFSQILYRAASSSELIVWIVFSHHNSIVVPKHWPDSPDHWLSDCDHLHDSALQFPSENTHPLPLVLGVCTQDRVRSGHTHTTRAGLYLQRHMQSRPMIAATTMQPMTRSIRIITGRSEQRKCQWTVVIRFVVTIAAGLVDVHQVSLLTVADHLRDVLLQRQAEAALVPAPTESAWLVPAANLGDDEDLAGPGVGTTVEMWSYRAGKHRELREIVKEADILSNHQTIL